MRARWSKINGVGFVVPTEYGMATLNLLQIGEQPCSLSYYYNSTSQLSYPIRRDNPLLIVNLNR